jgi:amidase
MNEILNLSVTEIAGKILKKEISSTEVVDVYLERIKEVNPQLNAIVQLAEGKARDEAFEADKDLAKGKIRGALHGVPMTLKDSFDSAGIVSAGGTLGRANKIPEKDATVLARLKNSGAILLGKTNTSEFTLSYETGNLVYGQTNNPHDLTRSPGGSSGGAAAVVAAFGAPFDIGSDYGGSLRYPAHCCGVTTIKPTSGRVPRTGHILPFGGILDSCQQVGPITRSVKDLKLILPIISGPDGIDPSIVPVSPGDPDKVNIKQLRVAFHTDNGILAPSKETAEAVTRAASILAAYGIAVDNKRPDGIEQSYEIMMDLLAADGGASIRRLLRESETQEHSIPWLKYAKPIDFDSFDSLIMRWYKFRSTMLAFFNDYDVLLSPVNSFAALPHGLIRDDLRAFSYTMTHNLTGFPVVVIRGGTSQDGLPVGIQIIAQPWREDIALAIAELLESELGRFPSVKLSDNV